MKPHLSQKNVLASIGVLLMASMPQWTLMPAWLTAVSLAIIGWRVAALRYGWRPVPLWLRVILAFLMLALVVYSYGLFWGRRAGAAMLTMMLSAKLMETYRIRDARLLVSMCLFLAAAQFFFFREIYMLLYVVAVVIGAVVTLQWLQRDDAEQTSLSEPEIESPPLSDTVRSAIRMLVIALPLAALLFFLFPRLGSPFWGMPEDALDGKTGLSDTMSPGSIQSLFLDDSPAFRVTFDGPLPPPAERYWRGPVLWGYDGINWSPNNPGYRTRAPDRLPDPQPDSYRYTVQLEPHERRWLFALDYPTATPPGSGVSSDYMLFSYEPVVSVKSYQVVSEPRFTADPEIRASFRSLALGYPEHLNLRSQAWIAELRQQYSVDQELINAVLRHFNESQFFYSLTPPLLGRNRVDEFLFETREGYCEHYASTFTLLMRMAGIPARVVTGYQGGFYNRNANYLLVKQSDAHAWSEVWLDGLGWQRVDPTAAVAPQRIRQNIADTLGGKRTWYDFAWVRSVRNSIDVIQHQWNQWIISFDAKKQGLLVGKLGLPFPDQAILVVLLLLLGLVTGALVRPLIRSFNLKREQDVALKLYRRFRKRLARLGVRSGPQDTPGELIGRAVLQLPERTAALQKIGDLYLRSRYGSQPHLLEDLRTALNAL